MNIPSSQVLYRKRVGNLGSRSVFGIGTIGGLHLVVATSRSGSGFETLGAGSHSGIAKFIAKRAFNDLEFDDMSKSGYIDPAHFADLIPQYEELTQQIRKAQGDA